MKLSDATALRVGSTAATKAYFGTAQVWPPSLGGTSKTLTISGRSGTRTNFVTRVDLSNMDSGWWSNVSSDGGNIRVKSAGTVVPTDLVWINTASQTGELFFKSTLGTSSNVFTVEVVSGASALAVTDTYGRNAVWSDYDAVWLAENGTGYSLVNRQGDASRDAAFVGAERHSYGSAVATYTGYGEELQGIAFDAASGHFVTSSTTALRRIDASYTVVATNTSVIADAGLSGVVDHVGDGCIVGGEFFVPIAAYPQPTTPVEWIAVFDPITLAYKRKYDVSAQGMTTSSITFNPVDGYFYLPDYNGSTLLYKFDTSFNYIGTTTLATATANIQGIHYRNGFFYARSLAAGNPLYRFNLDGTNRVSQLGTNPGDTAQGLTSTDDNTIIGVQSTLGGGKLVVFTRNWKITPGIGVECVAGSVNVGFAAGGLPKRTTWTVGASAAASVTGDSRGLMSYSDNSATSGNRATLAQRSTNFWGLWNSTDSWLNSTATVTVGQRRRLNYVHDGTAKRIVYAQGVGTTDAVVGQRPASTGDYMFLGQSNSAGAERFGGSHGYHYLRNGELDAGWLADETTSWETPASFYTIT